MKKRSGYIPIGKIGRPFGLKGWLKFWSWSDPPGNFLNYSKFWLSGSSDGEPIAVRQFEANKLGNGFIVRIDDCQDCDLARSYVGLEVVIKAGELKQLSQDQYYWHQLEGLKVWTGNSDAGNGHLLLGTVDCLFDNGAQDVMVIKPCADSIDGRKRMIPWVLDRVVLEVDSERAEILVDWQPSY